MGYSGSNQKHNNDGKEIDPSSARFDLSGLIISLKHGHTWEKGELESMILEKSAEKNVLLTVLHEGTEISSFQTNDSLTIQIIEGSVILHFMKESVTLNSGELLTINEKIGYSIDSIEDTALLMTLKRGN